MSTQSADRSSESINGFVRSIDYTASNNEKHVLTAALAPVAKCEMA